LRTGKLIGPLWGWKVTARSQIGEGRSQQSFVYRGGGKTPVFSQRRRGKRGTVQYLQGVGNKDKGYGRRRDLDQKKGKRERKISGRGHHKEKKKGVKKN